MPCSEYSDCDLQPHSPLWLIQSRLKLISSRNTLTLLFCWGHVISSSVSAFRWYVNQPCLTPPPLQWQDRAVVVATLWRREGLHSRPLREDFHNRRSECLYTQVVHIAGLYRSMLKYSGKNVSIENNLISGWFSSTVHGTKILQ